MSTYAFSGTQSPPPGIEQTVASILGMFDAASDTIVTGACVGVDAVVARVAYHLGFRVHTVVPPKRDKVDPEWRDYCHTFEEIDGPPDAVGYRRRNTRMIELADAVHVLPLYSERHRGSLRSGTWMTKRIARALGVPVWVHPLWEANSE